MNDRDRLIELMYSANSKFLNENITDEEAVELLADFLIENGVIVPPCKVGDTVYYFLDGSNYKKYETVNVVGFHTDKYRTAFEIEVCGVKMLVDIGFLGEKLFLTREAAEQVLKERE